jgi:hypothetical protein
MDTTDIVEAIDAEILRLKQAKSLLTGRAAPLKRSLPPAGRRTISPEGRARIAAAQKARWAKAKRE